MNYRHAFHAGNFADVLKHVVLMRILLYLQEKPAAFRVIDTHAGAGLYALDSEWARQREEYRDGIGRLWGRVDAPPAVADYLAMVARFNGDGALRRYPGSPFIALELLRAQDGLCLFEAHPTEGRVLIGNIGAAGRDRARRVECRTGDGFAGLKALLPPPPRRALVLIDPSYETKNDYTAVVKGLQEALKRFPTGTYALWYPMLAKLESRQLPERLKRLGAANWLHATLEVKAPARDGFGMHGSGMFIINPPWTLEQKLHQCLPQLAELLAQGEGARHGLESQST